MNGGGGRRGQQKEEEEGEEEEEEEEEGVKRLKEEEEGDVSRLKEEIEAAIRTVDQGRIDSLRVGQASIDQVKDSIDHYPIKKKRYVHGFNVLVPLTLPRQIQFFLEQILRSAYYKVHALGLVPASTIPRACTVEYTLLSICSENLQNTWS